MNKNIAMQVIKLLLVAVPAFTFQCLPSFFNKFQGESLEIFADITA